MREVASATTDDQPARLQASYGVVLGHDRLEPGDRLAALCHLERFAAPDATQVDAEVLPQLADADTLHDAQKVAHGILAVDVSATLV